MGNQRADEFFPCPHCGADVKVTAKFCRECGADEQVGWSDTGYGNDFDDEGYEDDFDYDEYVRREFPDQATPAAIPPKRMFVIGIVILLVLGMLASLLNAGFTF